MSVFFEQLLIFALTVAVVGALAHFGGEALPRGAFDASAFPWTPFKWERSGRVCEALRVGRWKDRLPDKSRYVKSACEKSIRASDANSAHLRALVQETCVAELVHWLLLVVSPVLMLVMSAPYAGIFTVLYGLSNIPFIMIQRYNRPRLSRLAERMERAERRDKEKAG